MVKTIAGTRRRHDGARHRPRGHGGWLRHPAVRRVTGTARHRRGLHHLNRPEGHRSRQGDGGRWRRNSVPPAAHAERRERRSRRGRRDRSRAREGRSQDRAPVRGGDLRAGRGRHCVQHLGAQHHGTGRRPQGSRPRRRHALLQPGAQDEAGRDRPRPGDFRGDDLGDAGSGGPDGEGDGRHQGVARLRDQPDQRDDWQRGVLYAAGGRGLRPRHRQGA